MSAHLQWFVWLLMLKLPESILPSLTYNYTVNAIPPLKKSLQRSIRWIETRTAIKKIGFLSGGTSQTEIIQDRRSKNVLRVIFLF